MQNGHEKCGPFICVMKRMILDEAKH
ncbi:hypothetical protein MTBUT4_120052 [Magnetospirillum sp. UT-4]|nr:hypothetical protein MTBUT4_120052 [Magnetospirillum sp. UT-4]